MDIHVAIVTNFLSSPGHKFHRVHSSLVLGHNLLHSISLHTALYHLQLPSQVCQTEEQRPSSHQRAEERGGYLGEDCSETQCGIPGGEGRERCTAIEGGRGEKPDQPRGEHYHAISSRYMEKESGSTRVQVLHHRLPPAGQVINSATCGHSALLSLQYHPQD